MTFSYCLLCYCREIIRGNACILPHGVHALFSLAERKETHTEKVLVPKKQKKKAPEIQENTNSHVWQHRTKMTYSDKLFLLLSFMKKKCKYKDEKFLG